jgi:cell division protease FtsH
LERLVDLLIEEETIEGDSFRQIVADNAQVADAQLAVPH